MQQYYFRAKLIPNIFKVEGENLSLSEHQLTYSDFDFFLDEKDIIKNIRMACAGQDLSKGQTDPQLAKFVSTINVTPDPVIIGNLLFTVNLKESIYLDADMIKALHAHIKTKIEESFGEYLLNHAGIHYVSDEDESLELRFVIDANHLVVSSRYAQTDWMSEVSHGHTVQSFKDWVKASINADFQNNPIIEPKSQSKKIGL